ncbi:hypothetical protein QBC46DRAFT_351513 [Diplogelasinospora grovesii]|uniref:Uncharacterized protein n=1 Tax=Diplogelasinospora grovesii TaxID=303347 RepID=A0AAN6NFR8_9PEZI|nr:hypothetical protein QBC46DRAFT_351513 [Diplogelasinospora grovesii]
MDRQDGVQMSSANVLEDIFKTLQRLETRLDGQNTRLGAIELSIRSGATSPTTTSGRSFSTGSDRMQMHHLHKYEEPTSPLTPPSSSQSAAQSPASLYKKSIAELRRRFEFIDSQSELNFPVSPMQSNCPVPWRRTTVDTDATSQHVSGDGVREDGWEDDLVYTESAYSRPLSRFDFDNPVEMPGRPLAPPDADVGQREAYHYQNELPGEPQATSIAVSSFSARSISPAVQDDSQNSEHARGSSIHSSSTSHSRRPHERVEMAFIACENFKASLRSSLSFRSSERRAARDERLRLAELAKPDAAAPTTAALEQGSGGKIATLESFFLRLVQEIGNRWFGKVDILVA